MIKKKSLEIQKLMAEIEKRSKELDRYKWNLIDPKEEQFSALQHRTCTFKGISIIIFQPEFSSFNEDVRKYLTKYNVEYSIEY